MKKLSSGREQKKNPGTKDRTPSLSDRKRLVAISLFLFFLFNLVIFQFFRIQIIDGNKWSKKAAQQHCLTVQEPFKRGVFYSNPSVKEGHLEQKQPLVIDVPLFHLYIDPKLIPDGQKGYVAKTLSLFLGANNKEAKFIREQFEKKSRSRKLA